MLFWVTLEGICAIFDSLKVPSWLECTSGSDTEQMASIKVPNPLWVADFSQLPKLGTHRAGGGYITYGERGGGG